MCESQRLILLKKAQRKIELEKQIWAEAVFNAPVHIIPDFTEEDLTELQHLVGM